MLFREKELILFDLDGTLIDSVPDLALAVNRMLETLGRERFEEERIRGWVGNGAAVLIRRALSGNREAEGKLDDALFEEARGLFLSHYGENLARRSRCYEGVPETLRRLRERGHRLAVVTNKPDPFVEPLLKAFGLEGLFEMIVGGESLPVKKPDPLPLIHSCESLGVEPARALMVGDSRNDIQAARAAGIHSVGVRYGYNYDEPIDVYGPDAVIDSFAELAEIVVPYSSGF